MTLADCYARFRATAYPYKRTVTNQIDPAAIAYEEFSDLEHMPPRSLRGHPRLQGRQDHRQDA